MMKHVLSLGGFLLHRDITNVLKLCAMLTRIVTTSDELINLETDNFVSASEKSSQAEIQAFTNYFELLSQIDQRLMQEDTEYKNKYRRGLNLEREEKCE